MKCPQLTSIIVSLLVGLFHLNAQASSNTAEELDLVLEELEPDNHYVIDDIRENTIPDRTGNHDIRISSPLGSSRISTRLYNIEDSITTKELDLNGDSYIDFGKKSATEVGNGFTWLLWMRGENKDSQKQIYFNAFNEYDDQVHNLIQLGSEERDKGISWFLKTIYNPGGRPHDYLPEDKYFSETNNFVGKGTKSITDRKTQLFIVRYDGFKLSVFTDKWKVISVENHEDFNKGFDSIGNAVKRSRSG